MTFATLRCDQIITDNPDGAGRFLLSDAEIREFQDEFGQNLHSSNDDCDPLDGDEIDELEAFGIREVEAGWLFAHLTEDK